MLAFLIYDIAKARQVARSVGGGGMRTGRGRDEDGARTGRDEEV